MRILNFLLVSLLFTCILFPQNKSTTITELRGMEDKNANTQLFYRLYSNWGNNYNGGNDNSIYHFDLSAKLDTLFLSSGGYWNPVMSGGSSVGNLEFWDNDPTKYIYIGISCGIDCDCYMENFNSEIIKSGLFIFSFAFGLGISNSNDSLIFSSASNKIIKTTDGGINWFISDSTDYLDFLCLSPYNDKEIFALDLDGYIEKSTNGGKTFQTTDTSLLSTSTESNKIYFDNDSLHIYRIYFAFDGVNPYTYLALSTNKGELNSWSKKYSGKNSLYLSLDYSKSGTIYLADGNNIFISTDYGSTFILYKTLDSTIVGIYKKPASDKLYAATKHDIFEITSSSIKFIKHLVTSVDDKPKDIPAKFLLYQNYPNPFNPSTTITYETPRSGLVQLKIYDILGREVALLVNENQSAGKHTVLFDSQQMHKQLSSGVYFFRLKFGSNVLNKKMVLLR